MKSLEALPFALLLAAAGALIAGAATLFFGYAWTTALLVAAAGSLAGYASGIKALGERRLPPSASTREFMAKDNEQDHP